MIGKTVLVMTLFLAAGLPAGGAPAIGLQPLERTTYHPVSKTAQYTLGRLTLGENFAAFAKLKGHMSLHHAGDIPCGAEIYGCGRVYRVINDTAFASTNAKRLSCHVRWLAVAKAPDPVTGRDEGELNISLFDIADFPEYSPDKLGLYSGDTYGPE